MSEAFNPHTLDEGWKMNKRAKKRVKEAIEKGNLEREKAREEKNHPASNGRQERRGFLPKPAKKRG